MDARKNQRMIVFGGTPWFDYASVTSGEVKQMAMYAREGEHLPGNFPLSTLDSWTWPNQFWIRDADLRTDGYSRTFRGRHADLTRAENGGICRLFETSPIQTNLRIDIFMYPKFD